MCVSEVCAHTYVDTHEGTGENMQIRWCTQRKGVYGGGEDEADKELCKSTGTDSGVSGLG